MAYACPVCGEPQVDAEHLANHVAFTAIAGDAAHEEWLDATVAEWGQLGQSELGDRLVEHAAQTEFPVDLEDEDGTKSGGGGHRREHGPDRDRSAVSSSIDEETRDVLAEARDLTRRMQPDDAESDGETGDSTEAAGERSGADVGDEDAGRDGVDDEDTNDRADVGKRDPNGADGGNHEDRSDSETQ